MNCCNNIRNDALNYGYAILRSIIANSLTCKGFILHQGIHHFNQLNQFNLADDIIEPFRALVDIEVYRMFEEKNLTDSINPNLEKVYNTTVKKVTEDYDKLSFNTAISQLMIFVNTVYKENDLPKEYQDLLIKRAKCCEGLNV